MKTNGKLTFKLLMYFFTAAKIANEIYGMVQLIPNFSESIIKVAITANSLSFRI